MSDIQFTPKKIYHKDFKTKVAKEAIKARDKKRGGFAETCRKYELSYGLVANWMKVYTEKN